MDHRRHPTSPTTIQRARQLRREMTFAEVLLWNRLRAGQLDEMRFRRQHPVGPYIADFYCAKAKLVIEIDGMSHEDRAAYDDDRTRFLAAAGLRVVRFTDDEVLQDLNRVVQAIACECGLEV